jgi:hypothetical protein
MQRQFDFICEIHLKKIVGNISLAQIYKTYRIGLNPFSNMYFTILKKAGKKNL